MDRNIWNGGQGLQNRNWSARGQGGSMGGPGRGANVGGPGRGGTWNGGQFGGNMSGRQFGGNMSGGQFGENMSGGQVGRNKSRGQFRENMSGGQLGGNMSGGQGSNWMSRGGQVPVRGGQIQASGRQVPGLMDMRRPDHGDWDRGQDWSGGDVGERMESWDEEFRERQRGSIGQERLGPTWDVEEREFERDDMGIRQEGHVQMRNEDWTGDRVERPEIGRRQLMEEDVEEDWIEGGRGELRGHGQYDTVGGDNVDLQGEVSRGWRESPPIGREIIQRPVDLDDEELEMRDRGRWSADRDGVHSRRPRDLEESVPWVDEREEFNYEPQVEEGGFRHGRTGEGMTIQRRFPVEEEQEFLNEQQFADDRGWDGSRRGMGLMDIDDPVGRRLGPQEELVEEEDFIRRPRGDWRDDESPEVEERRLRRSWNEGQPRGDNLDWDREMDDRGDTMGLERRFDNRGDNWEEERVGPGFNDFPEPERGLYIKRSFPESGDSFGLPKRGRFGPGPHLPDRVPGLMSLSIAQPGRGRTPLKGQSFESAPFTAYPQRGRGRGAPVSRPYMGRGW